MVTIRISDRQRLIQPYIHNYAWLLFAALALYSTHLASAEDAGGERLDSRARSSAAALHSQCMQLVGDCLMKAHQGKGDCRSCTETRPAPSRLCRKSLTSSEMPCSVRGNPIRFCTGDAHPGVELIPDSHMHLRKIVTLKRT